MQLRWFGHVYLSSLLAIVLSTMDDATAKFHASLPYALLPVSPSLAALASVRVKSFSNSCHQCGSLLHRGESSVRTIRSKAPRSRAIQTTCFICGWVQQEPLVARNASLFARTKKQSAATTPAVVRGPKNNSAEKKVEEAPKHSVAPQNGPSSQKATPTPSLPNSRPKNKGSLQSMLDRNKKRESKEKQKGKGDAVGGGLAMFLNNL
ncbi:hypothetical protein C8R45DRAFT_957745 [Mycena sanguinolenta]|nr:hypothetical protein C8R45DRAFT_957745 [Mycena sanguinolenta]